MKHRDDFWKMVWLSGSHTIAMLTITEECCQYWPNRGETIICGDMTIEGLSEEKKGNFFTRKIRIVHNQEARTITHYQYMSWPDFGVASIKEMAGFVKMLLGTSPGNPLVAHCRAGVGRTGTLLAALFAYQNSSHDYYNTALEIRKGRMASIQTADQYECGYQVLQELLNN